MRFTAEVILELLSDMTIPDILKDHPKLEREDILASLNYAKLLMAGQFIKIAA